MDTNGGELYLYPHSICSMLVEYGQYIFVIPHLNMVVVMTAQNFEDYFSIAFKILLGHIVPAVKEK